MKTIIFYFINTPGNTRVDCNFDINMCYWKTTSLKKGFNWQRHNGETPTKGTGPHYDHTRGTVDGFYLYADASPPASPNDTTFLVNAGVPNLYGGCFEFWYYMWGEHVGILTLTTTVSCCNCKPKFLIYFIYFVYESTIT